MNKCLNCQKEYVPKRSYSKYCSDSCRVAYFRKNGKKDAIKPLQLQVLYNAMLEMLQKGGNLPIKNIDTPIAINNSNTNKVVVSRNEIKRSPANWVELRRECQDADEYNQWLEDLENDIHLTLLEKKQIKATN